MEKRIMVIDDEESIRKSFVLSLEGAPYEVETASSGEEGIQRIKKNKPDLIFLDLKMPGLNGVETLREIRKIDRTLPVYIVTAFQREFLELLKSAAKDGIQFEVMKKPLGADQIQKIVKAILDEPVRH